MVPDPDRVVASVSALFGGVFWGLFSLSTALLAGQPVAADVLLRAVANVAIGIIGGALLAYFVGPALAPLIPFAALRDLHAVGFGLGVGAWEVAPFLYRGLRSRAKGFAKGASK